MAGRRFPLDKFPTLLKNPPPNVDIMLYDKKKREHHPGDNTVKTSRLDRIEERVDQLDERINRIEIKVDNLTMTVEKLAKIVTDSFSELRQDVKDINARIDRIDIRLDYIVKANNLKDSK